MKYIISELKKKFSVRVFSFTTPSLTKNPTYHKKQERHNVDKAVQYFYSPFNCKTPKIRNRVNYVLAKIWLFCSLYFKLNQQSTVVVYHNTRFYYLILLLKKFRKFKLILEVEEIYSNVWKQYEKEKKHEEKLFSLADGFIFAAEETKNICCSRDKPYAVINGSYENHIPSDKVLTTTLDQVKLLYVGSIDRVKNGAFKAVQIMDLLDDKYRLTIAGYGNDDDISSLKELIIRTNAKKQYDCVQFIGKIEGEHLYETINSHNIALNPQSLGDYMATGFPSKVLAFLSCGITVVSTPVRNVVKSEISEFINFSTDDSNESIANCVINAKETDREKLRAKLLEISESVCNDLERLIGAVNE